MDSPTMANLHRDFSKEKRPREKCLRSLLWSLAAIAAVSSLFLNVSGFILVYEVRATISDLVTSKHIKDFRSPETLAADRPGQLAGAMKGNSRLSEISGSRHRSERSANIGTILHGISVAVQENREALELYHLTTLRELSKAAPNIVNVNVGSGLSEDEGKVSMNQSFVALKRESEKMTEESIKTLNQSCENVASELILLKTSSEELKNDLLAKLKKQDDLEEALKQYLQDNRMSTVKISETLEADSVFKDDVRSLLRALRDKIPALSMAPMNRSSLDLGSQLKELSDKVETLLNLQSIGLFCTEGKGCTRIRKGGKSKCFKIVTDKATWDQAKANCKTMGGHLAEILDNETQQYLNRIELGLKNKNTWLGATDRQNEGDWRWDHSGSKVPMEKNRWDSGNPNNLNGNQHCLEIGGSLTWNDDKCDAMNPYLCEKEADNCAGWS